MSRPRTAIFTMALILVSACVACRPPLAMGQASACVTNDDAGLIRVALRKGFGFSSSDALAIVSNESKCASAVAAFNTATNLAGTPGAVAKAVVISASDTQYVVWSRDQPTTTGERSLVWFSPTWTVRRHAAY
jgi:hypothetical protein